MTPQEKLDIAGEIMALNAAYWHEVDRQKGENAHAFFTEDGLFTTTLRQFLGRKEISAYYQWRQERETTRTTRHLIANQHVEVQDASHATSNWILMLHAADGDPVLPSQPAMMIADVHDLCERGADGCWRYASRTITAVFKRDAPATGRGDPPFP